MYKRCSSLRRNALEHISRLREVKEGGGSKESVARLVGNEGSASEGEQERVHLQNAVYAT